MVKVKPKAAQRGFYQQLKPVLPALPEGKRLPHGCGGIRRPGIPRTQQPKRHGKLPQQRQYVPLTDPAVFMPRYHHGGKIQRAVGATLRAFLPTRVHDPAIDKNHIPRAQHKHPVVCPVIHLPGENFGDLGLRVKMALKPRAFVIRDLRSAAEGNRKAPTALGADLAPVLCHLQLIFHLFLLFAQYCYQIQQYFG